jgi:hypothetical protein
MLLAIGKPRLDSLQRTLARVAFGGAKLLPGAITIFTETFRQSCHQARP